MGRGPQPCWSVRLRFDARDCWVGVFWKQQRQLHEYVFADGISRETMVFDCVAVHVCLVPFFPLSTVIPIRAVEDYP